MALSAATKLGKAITEALGLKHCTALDIHIAYDELITVTAKVYPDEDGIKQFPLIFQEYELVPKGEPRECPTAIPITCIGEGIESYEFKVIK